VIRESREEEIIIIPIDCDNGGHIAAVGPVYHSNIMGNYVKKCTVAHYKEQVNTLIFSAMKYTKLRNSP